MSQIFLWNLCIDGLAQGCDTFSVFTMELTQNLTKLSICWMFLRMSEKFLQFYDLSLFTRFTHKVDKNLLILYCQYHGCWWLGNMRSKGINNHGFWTSLLRMYYSLTHWGRDQIDAISQTTLSNAFSRMIMNEFRLGFHWSLFLRFELKIFQHWYR